ncbi:glycosyltransferase [Grimontia hollisae]|uniref:glycosyltransferase n=1 Tax=Grimontia hollisae TaxID=673 RepID=UPI0013036365|nr:glycosyltransferase [Grimontia hollisae]
MKKIIIIINSMSSGGAERVTSILANELAFLGMDVTLATYKSISNDFYELNGSIHRLVLENSLDQDINFFKKINEHIKLIRKIRNLCMDRSETVVIGMMSHSAIHVALATIGKKNVKSIGSERSYPPRMPLGKFWELIRKHSYRFLDELIVLSSEAMVWCYDNTYANRISIIANPVVYPIPYQAPIILTSKYINTCDKVILTVGRMSEEKGHIGLIKSVESILKKDNSWKLVIIGDGPDKKSVQKIVKELGLDEKVKLPGKVGNLHDWYSQADMFVLCSDFEGFPNTLVEAMSYGVASISFDCDTGPRDIIENNVNGILVEKDFDELKYYINLLAMDKSLRNKLGNEAKKIKSKFSKECFINKWMSKVR